MASIVGKIKDINFRVTSDLLYANKLAPETAQVLFHNVLSFVKNISPSCDMTEFSQLLEDEAQGNLDSDKILSVEHLKILRSALIVFFKSTEKNKDDLEGIKQYCQSKIGFTEPILDALMKSMEKHAILPRQEMKVNRLLDFKWVVLNEIKSNKKEDLKDVRVLLSFKVADDDGDYVIQNLDTNIEEALAIKNELSQVIDMLN
ncbi:unnamed protein product [Moneuplotes crassus]|uniref:COMM domain-containing protein 3 n=1 Tax=Euplotes crassus TaxID=5936 RepID=A0AAD1XWJ1_EUPCR|nr:unnamed protein product [Moneuplotes crassus]